MKRLKIIFLLFFFVAGTIFLFISPAVQAGIKASPAKLVITMPEGYPEGEIQYKIKVTNPCSYDIKVSSKVSNPFEITADFTTVPDLSWISVFPESLDIPAKSSKEVEVIIDMPESEKNQQYNKNWEVWVIVQPVGFSEVGGMVIQTQVAVKLFIHTPTGTATPQTPQVPPPFYIAVGIILGLVLIFVTFSYFKKKKDVQVNRAAMFYVKKKIDKDHKDKKT